MKFRTSMVVEEEKECDRGGWRMRVAMKGRRKRRRITVGEEEEGCGQPRKKRRRVRVCNGS